MLSWLLVLIPLSAALKYLFQAPPLSVFGTAALGIVPLADWIRRATEQIAKQAGPAIGGLVNVSFGNAPELILALFVLMAGHAPVVKAQITGSIIGNGLLGLGLSIVVGCWGREKLTFNRARAGLLSSLLILSTIALLLPALFDYTERSVLLVRGARGLDKRLSLAVSVVMILLYAANLVYTLYTHRDVFSPAPEDDPSAAGAGWPLWKSLAVLAAGTAGTALEAELVSGALESSAAQLGLTTFFLGIIVLAVVGNAAEYASAVYFARRGRIGMALNITLGSTIQVALLMAPLLVLLSYGLGHPMNLVFTNPVELIAIAGVAFVVNSIAQDGETTWFEGTLLLGLYLLLGIAFFYLRL